MSPKILLVKNSNEEKIYGFLKNEFSNIRSANTLTSALPIIKGEKIDIVLTQPDEPETIRELFLNYPQVAILLIFPREYQINSWEPFEPYIQGFILEEEFSENLLKLTVQYAIHKKKMKNVQENHSNYFNIIQNHPDPIVCWRSNFQITFVNSVFCKLFEKTEKELIGKELISLFPENHREELKNCFTNLLISQKAANCQCEIIKPGGPQFWIQWTNIPILNSENKVNEFLSVGRDITLIKQKELKLHENNILLNTILNSIPIHIFWKDQNSRYMGCNFLFSEAAGVNDPKNIIGKTDYELPWTQENTEHYISSDKQVVKTCIPILHHREMQTQADGSEKTILTSRVPLKDTKGKVLGILGIYSDITEQVSMEKKLLESTEELEEAHRQIKLNQQQLIQSEKMASIGQLASGIAHEINNPVGFVMSNLRTLREYTDEIKTVIEKYEKLHSYFEAEDFSMVKDKYSQIRHEINNEDFKFILEDLEQLLNESSEGMERIKEIVQSLKSFARADDGQVKEFDVNEGIETTLKIVWNELKYKCEIVKDLGEVKPITGHPAQLNQVFMNLFVNAAQAIQEKGTISIRTTTDNDNVLIKISDTGNGIPSENLTKIFDPFFTTKPVGKGTGLGLAISYGIIQKHNGSIEVQSKEGMGTTFVIRLPAERNTDENNHSSDDKKVCENDYAI